MDDGLGAFIAGIVVALFTMALVWVNTSYVDKTKDDRFYINTHWRCYELKSPNPIEINIYKEIKD